MSGIHLTPRPFGFIQARLSSTRLSEKILQKIPEVDGFILLDHIYLRLNTVLPKEQIVFLIPENEDRLNNYLDSKGYNYFLGSMDDVRERYIKAAEFYKAKDIIRLTGDNPFVDIISIELLWEAMFHLKTRHYCLAMNGLPLGMGVECFSYESLIDIDTTQNDVRHREHVSLHIKEDLIKNSVYRLTPPHLVDTEIEASSKIRMTIDEEADLQVLRNVWSQLGQKNPFFGAKEVISLFNEEPGIFDINSPVKQVRFDLPRDQTGKKSVSLTYGNPIKLGTGHFERCKSLSIELQMHGYHVSTNPTKPTNFSAYIVDARETLPNGDPALLIDHVSDNANTNTLVYFLPHPNRKMTYQDHIPFYSSPLLDLYQNRPIEKGLWMVYAGNMIATKCELIDRFLIDVLMRRWEIKKWIRIGGTPPTDPRISFFNRLNKQEYYEIISRAEGFVSYFGQSMMEAIYLKKKTALFGMTEIHKKLGIYFSELVNSIYLGEPEDWRMPPTKFQVSQYELTRNAHAPILRWLEQI